MAFASIFFSHFLWNCTRMDANNLEATWTSYQICKTAVCACECGERFSRHRFQKKPLVSDPGMHPGTCVMHVPWCMSDRKPAVARKTFPTFPVHAHPAILRIWQEAHWLREWIGGVTRPQCVRQLYFAKFCWKRADVAMYIHNPICQCRLIYVTYNFISLKASVSLCVKYKKKSAIYKFLLLNQWSLKS